MKKQSLILLPLLLATTSTEPFIREQSQKIGTALCGGLGGALATHLCIKDPNNQPYALALAIGAGSLVGWWLCKYITPEGQLQYAKDYIALIQSRNITRIAQDATLTSAQVLQLIDDLYIQYTSSRIVALKEAVRLLEYVQTAQGYLQKARGEYADEIACECEQLLQITAQITKSLKGIINTIKNDPNYNANLQLYEQTRLADAQEQTALMLASSAHCNCYR